MKRISIDELIDMVDSRYSLVTIISKRARQIIDGSDVLVKTATTKPVGIAIEEFYAGEYDPIYDYDKYKKELEENATNEQVDEAVDVESDNDEEADSSDAEQ